MSDPILFTDATPRFGLPFLYSGQTQKEAFVNEAIARLDCLLHRNVSGVADSPPTVANDGSCWIVGEGASGDWAGLAGQLACRSSGRWLLLAPVEGMLVYDVSGGQLMVRAGEQWKKTSALPEPTGGMVVDTEVRAVVNTMIAALRTLGIFPTA